MGLLVPKEDVSARYIWYYSRSDAYRDYLNALAPGANINNLRFDDLATLEIPLPPLDEQKRIVAVLDQAFAAIDRARANIEKNIQNVNELFVEGLETVVIRHSHASASTTLSEVCTFENGDRGVNYPGRKAYAPKGVAFINAGHLDDGVIDWASMNFIPEEIFNRLSKGKVRKGDILFCLRGSLGKFAKVDHSDTGAIASSLVILRTGSRLAADFLSIYFRTKHSRKMIEKYAGGAAQPNLSAGDLKKFTITLPRVEDQYLAIAEFQQLQANMNQVREAYSYALVELAVLRQSLLQAAFSGQLS